MGRGATEPVPQLERSPSVTTETQGGINKYFLKIKSGEGNGNPLQYSCLENPTDRGAWEAIVHGVTRVRRNLETKSPEKDYPQLGSN